jgi:prephenate dehydrogenase
MIQRLCLIGVGLIGGSLSLALQQKGQVGEVVGVDPNRANLETAQQLGIIDRFCSDPVAGVEGADWVVIATPVGAIPAIFSTLKFVWRDDAVYTDTGSTKADVVEAMCREILCRATRLPGRRVLGRVPPTRHCSNTSG